MSRARAPLAAALALAAAGCGSRVDAAEDGMRAVWITRFDYAAREDVERIVEDCHHAGFDTLVFQVRGNATAFYRSSFEPWAIELGGADPGFDPLALALELARARGMRLHAWVNVVPAWWGTDPPASPEQVVNARPEWLWYDQEGERQGYSERFYVSLNPCLPEVRAYLASVMEELLERYPVDGLHLDYIRLPHEPPASRPGQDFPRDARTLALYAEETGLAPDDDDERWDRWRADQVTRLVREIRRTQERVRPEAVLSAAVGPESAEALVYHQDWRTWIEEGLVDALFPMNYTVETARCDARLDDWAERAARVSVVMGLRVDGIEVDELRRRMRASLERFAGYCLFAYSALYDSRNEEIDEQTPERRGERARRRKALLPVLGAR